MRVLTSPRRRFCFTCLQTSSRASSLLATNQQWLGFGALPRPSFLKLEICGVPHFHLQQPAVCPPGGSLDLLTGSMPSLGSLLQVRVEMHWALSREALNA